MLIQNDIEAHPHGRINISAISICSITPNQPRLTNRQLKDRKRKASNPTALYLNSTGSRQLYARASPFPLTYGGRLRRRPRLGGRDACRGSGDAGSGRVCEYRHPARLRRTGCNFNIRPRFTNRRPLSQNTRHPRPSGSRSTDARTTRRNPPGSRVWRRFGFGAPGAGLGVAPEL